MKHNFTIKLNLFEDKTGLKIRITLKKLKVKSIYKTSSIISRVAVGSVRMNVSVRK